MRCSTILIPILAGLALLVALRPASACMWDKDTLAVEMSGKTPVVEAIVGYYDVFPPRYYEMRLERVTREVARDPTRLDLYDDAGVACERLGKSDQAIEWMAKKRLALDKLPKDSPDRHTHEYRYLANLGTFHAHSWVRRGANRNDLAELRQAESLIRHAIETNPDAHFGREMFQLLVLQWLVEPPKREACWLLAAEPPRIERLMEGEEIPAGFQQWNKADIWERAPEGFAGLVVLGGAQQSLDVMLLMRNTLGARRDASLSYLAALRARELVRGGAKSLIHPGEVIEENQFDGKVFMLDARDQPAVERYFKEARAAADNRRALRNAFLEAAMARGEHPDTNPALLKEMPDGPPLPPVRVPPLTPEQVQLRMMLLTGSTCLVMAVSLLLNHVWKLRRRGRSAPPLHPVS